MIISAVQKFKNHLDKAVVADEEESKRIVDELELDLENLRRQLKVRRLTVMEISGKEIAPKKSMQCRIAYRFCWKCSLFLKQQIY